MKSLFDHGEKETTTIGAEDDVDSVWLRFVQTSFFAVVVYLRSRLCCSEALELLLRN